MPQDKTYQYELDGSTVIVSDAILTGRQIRSQAGLNPASEYLLIEIGDATSRSIGLEENISLDKNNPIIMRSFQTDRSYSFTINERGFEWGDEEISETDIRTYGNIPDNHALIFDSKGDRPIEVGDVVRLKAKGVERIISKPVEKICIIVNTIEEYVEPGRLSFGELAKLAFPNTQVMPNTEYTVSYRKGTDNNPEGSLISGEFVKLKRGMIFDVSETDKS